VFGFPVPHAEDSIRLLEAGGVPAFRTVESCADTIALVVNRRAPDTPVTVVIPAAVNALISAAESGVMNEVASAAVFEALGMSVPEHTLLSPDTSAAGATQLPAVVVKAPDIVDLDFPVVAKLVSNDLPHKTEAGAIATGLNNIEELQLAITTMLDSVSEKNPLARIQGVLVQETCIGLGEALIGLTRDPLVGPVVTIAAGGVMAEIYKDASVRPAPVSIATAREMIEEVAGFALLRGYRGSTRGDIEALAQTVVLLSGLAVHDRVAEAEINPLLVRSEGVVLLDALICKS